MQFFLRGHERKSDFLHPGFVNSIDPNCNILFLEVEPCTLVSRPPPLPTVSILFNGLDLEDEQVLLELVADQVRLKLPDSLNSCFPLFFPQSTDEEEAGGGDLGLLEERWSYLINMYNNLGGGVVNWQLLPGLSSDGSQIVKRILDRLTSFASNCNENCAATTTNTTATKRKTVARTFIDGIKQAFGRSNCRNETNIFSTFPSRERESSNQASGRSNCRNETSIFSTSPSRERESSKQAFGRSNCRNETSIKRDDLQEFLQVSDTIRLSISGLRVGRFYPGVWPLYIHDDRYALYKLPLDITTVGDQYGLWDGSFVGGSFGCPPGQPAEDEPITALDIFFIAYEECRGRPTVFAT
ncbi:hypothetical protein MRB53_033977 [Persea americana]|uniref:Uncharacterized protein n=1 Tax=Persea americana TaxID=3435 RepID=A0ACC2KWJ3_PERAE|nr:hypothetical protein MRB53_033977 [Persea americana]